MNTFNDKEFIQYSDKKVKEEKKNLALYFAVNITLYVLLFFFLLFFVWYTVFISTHSFYGVKGVSMMPTLNAQISKVVDPLVDKKELSYDAVYVDKSTKPQIFDIIVMKNPDPSSEAGKSVIKRLMATAGDYVSIAKGKTESGSDCFYFYRIANGTDLTSYTDDLGKLDEMSGENEYTINTYEDWWESKNFSAMEIEVEVGGTPLSQTYEYNFFLNFLYDFNPNQVDTQKYFVSEGGLVYVKVPEGKFFYLGDNRGHSTDARNNGFCDTSYIIGRTEFVVYNYNFVNRIVEVIKFYFAEMEKFFAR